MAVPFYKLTIDALIVVTVIVAAAGLTTFGLDLSGCSLSPSSFWWYSFLLPVGNRVGTQSSTNYDYQCTESLLLPITLCERRNMTISRKSLRIPDDPSITKEENDVGNSSSPTIPDLVIVKDRNGYGRRVDGGGGTDEEESRPSTQSDASSSDSEETTTTASKRQHTRKRTFLIVILLALCAIALASVAIVVGIITHNNESNNNSSNSNTANESDNLQQQGQLSSPSTVGSVGEDSGGVSQPSNVDTTTSMSDYLTNSTPEDPTNTPTSSPTSSPSSIPSDLPSNVPSETPTSRPTPDPIPVNPVPLNPPPGYFNYDDNTPYGPSNWHLVDTSGTWLREFGKDGWGAWKGIRRNNKNTKDEDLTQNLCNANVRKQSPKDMVEIVNCSATHEIRTKCAVDPLWDDEAFSKVILPHKLSIVPAGRPCLEVLENGLGIDECRTHQPPIVDYPGTCCLFCLIFE